MRDRQRMLALQSRPDLRLEDPDDFVQGRQGAEERLRKAESTVSMVVYEFERRDIDLVSPDLAVPDHPVAGELKPCKLIC
jgi:hypothetical protein